jgi:hypothetical protein
LGRKQVQIGKAVKLSGDNSLIFVLENAEHSHRHAVEEQGNGHRKNMRRICENTCDFAPAEHLFIFAIGVGVTTPIICKVSAIHLALLLSKNLDSSGRGGDETGSGEPKGGGEGSLLREVF